MNRYILLLFMGLTCSLNAQVIEIKNVQYFKQEKTEWCAAAVSQSVLLYRGIMKDQCDIMNYVKSVDASYGPICCPDPPSNLPYNCNKGVPLGSEYAPPACVYGILKEFGNFHHHIRGEPIEIWEIVSDLKRKNPIIAKWDHKNPSYGDPVAHMVVIYGINNDNINDSIYYMDPAPTNQDGGLQRLPYNKFKDNSKSKWKYSLTYGGCFGRGEGDCPCHCYNGRWDPEYGEQGIDCGYPCPPCPYIPPPPPVVDCTNCRWDYKTGEEGIDCGGPCPPCEDLPDELVVGALSDLEYMALKKITTRNGNNMTIQSGKKVSFITEEEGSIVLLPGFRAASGCTFTTQMKDLSAYMRECPEQFCPIIPNLPSNCERSGYWHPIRTLYINNLYYAKEIEYEIYDDESGKCIYNKVVKVLNNGSVHLWNCINYAIILTGTVSYTINYSVTYCNGEKHDYTHQFTVSDGGIGIYDKSPTDDPENPENTAPSLSPPNGITLQDENVVIPNFVIIPNPNLGTFQIETNFPLTEIVSLKVVNSLGAPVYETQNLASNEIQLLNSGSGLYFVVIILKNGTVLTQKMMVQR